MTVPTGRATAPRHAAASPPDGEQAIVAGELVKTYGDVTALAGLSFTVDAGTVFGLLGPNGAGKSTTIKILTTLSKATSGSASVAGLDVRRSPGDVRRAIGVVTQGSGTDPMATGRENLLLAGRIHGLRGRAAKSRVDALLERFGLTGAAARIVKTYSGGMQRKLDVAMGLVHEPKVLFLDEPTTGLDPQARAEMWAEIARLATRERLTVMLTTHYLEEADHLADRLLIVDRGEAVAEGSPEQLKSELRGDAVVIEVAPDADPVRAAAAVGGLAGTREVTAEGRTIRTRVDHGASAVPAVLAALEKESVAVAAVTVARPSLDDVYLRHTGRSFAAAEEVASPMSESDGAFAVWTDEQRSGAERSASSAGGKTVSSGGAKRTISAATVLPHSTYLTGRLLRNMGRQPAFVVIMLIQPMIWLLLFGQLFKRVVELPGFASGSYIDFLTPGVVVMTVLFSSGWAGMGLIDDMDRGVMDRMLSSPVSRIAMMIASVANQAVTIVVQALIVVLVGLLLGASFSGGVLGVAVMLLASVLLAAAFSSLSNGMALIVRTPEALIGFSTMLTLPLSFLSSAMMAREVAPEWIQTVSSYNPVDWTVVASREALSANPDWSAIWPRLGGLLVVAVVAVWLASRAFRAYQRSQ